MTNSKQNNYELALYFETIPKLFQWFCQFPLYYWSNKIPIFLEEFFANFSEDKNIEQIQKCAYIGEHISFFQHIRIEKEVFVASLGIYLAKGVDIEAGVTIKPFCLINSNSYLRQSAYLREYTIVGSFCIIGHCTEIKNSIIFEHSELGHFNYIGDSVIGSYCNLGAGSILCNLAFRTKEQKKNQHFPKFSLMVDKKKIFFSKKGVVLGDGSETGCNSTLGPLAFFGKEAVIYPNVYISQGIYAPQSRLKYNSKS